MAKYGAISMLNRYYNGSLMKALQAIYPEHAWNSWRFSTRHYVARKSLFSKDQYLLFQYMQRVSPDTALKLPPYIFPVNSIEFNYSYSDFAKRGKPLEFDVSQSCPPAYKIDICSRLLVSSGVSLFTQAGITYLI